jgi:hypothetical protein
MLNVVFDLEVFIYSSKDILFLDLNDTLSFSIAMVEILYLSL